MEPRLHRLQPLLVVGEAVGQADVGEQQHLLGGKWEIWGGQRGFGGVGEALGVTPKSLGGVPEIPSMSPACPWGCCTSW